MKNNFIVVILFLFTSCSNIIPFEVQQELNKMTPKNQKKFEEVFKHYNSHKDKLKLRASYYLIVNINDFGFYQGVQLDQYDELFNVLASKPADYKLKLPWYSNEVDKIMDSLEVIYGKLDPNLLYFEKDIDVFTATSFIKYIDDSFEAWGNPWCKHLTFDEFCEYVLPYRNGLEKLEDWRSLFLSYYKRYIDTLPPDASMIDVAKQLNSEAELKYAKGLSRYITAISPSNMLSARFGSCADMSTYKAMVMRSFGIPVCTDFFPQWGNDNNTHSWNAIMNETGEMLSMDSIIGDRNAAVAYKFQIAKVYRKTFSKQMEMIAIQQSNNQNIPPLFLNTRIIDVTDKYVPVSNIELNVENIPAEIPLVYLCVFNNNNFTPIAYGKVENTKVKFNNLGRNVLYFPFFINNRRLQSAGNAFILDEYGNVKFSLPEELNQKLILTRKFHFHPRKEDWLKCLVNGKFQGSNNSDFSDAVTLAQISSIPSQHMEQLEVSDVQKYKFMRFLFDAEELKLEYDYDGACIAEIEFIDYDGQVLKGLPKGTDAQMYSEYTPDKCFDGNVLTFFEDARKGIVGKWVGLELDEPKQISKIRYSARNDLNCVQKGDLYELLYWNNNNFISLGQQVANDTLLIYNNCPENAIFWLRNLSGGKEERVFTYENDKQVWW